MTTIGLCLLAGCGGSSAGSTDTPNGTVHALFDALTRKDAKATCALLTPTARGRLLNQPIGSSADCDQGLALAFQRPDSGAAGLQSQPVDLTRSSPVRARAVLFRVLPKQVGPTQIALDVRRVGSKWAIDTGGFDFLELIVGKPAPDSPLGPRAVLSCLSKAGLSAEVASGKRNIRADTEIQVPLGGPVGSNKAYVDYFETAADAQGDAKSSDPSVTIKAQGSVSALYPSRTPAATVANLRGCIGF
jgi:hypothetical protein